jgi:hypothetical protein
MIELKRQEIAGLAAKLPRTSRDQKLADDLTREMKLLGETLPMTLLLQTRKGGTPTFQEKQVLQRLKTHEVNLQKFLAAVDAQGTSANLAIDARSKAIRLSPKSDAMEIQMRQQAQATNKADEQKKQSQDHTKALKEAVRKMLDQIAEINRATNL